MPFGHRTAVYYVRVPQLREIPVDSATMGRLEIIFEHGPVHLTPVQRFAFTPEATLEGCLRRTAQFESWGHHV